MIELNYLIWSTHKTRLTSSNVSCLSGRYGNSLEIPKIPFQWKVPVQFDPSINLHPEYNYGYGYMSNPVLYSFLAQSCIDDSINLILENISNISTLIKDFLNHHLTEIGWMQSPLTKSDRFLVGLLITFIYNSPFSVSTPYMTQCHDWD